MPSELEQLSQGDQDLRRNFFAYLVYTESLLIKMVAELCSCE